MPVAGGEHQLIAVVLGEVVQPIGDLIALRDRKGAVGMREIALEVDDDQRLGHPALALPHRVIATPGAPWPDVGRARLSEAAPDDGQMSPAEGQRVALGVYPSKDVAPC
jgi:hypothetical protein